MGITLNLLTDSHQHQLKEKDWINNSEETFAELCFNKKPAVMNTFMAVGA